LTQNLFFSKKKFRVQNFSEIEDSKDLTLGHQGDEMGLELPPKSRTGKRFGKYFTPDIQKKFFFNFVERQKNINTLSLILLQRT